MRLYSTMDGNFHIQIGNPKEEFGVHTPAEKLPNCPYCEQDELALLNHETMMCYSCCKHFYFQERLSTT